MTEFKTRLTDDLNIATRPAAALADHFETESDLVEAFRDDADFDEIDGVGRRTSQKLWDYLESEYPEVDRERIEASEAYCTEYTTDHELPADAIEDGVTYFAFVCPRCSNTNPLEGEPEGFENRPFACTTCNWVSLLEKESLREFADGELSDAEPEVPA